MLASAAHILKTTIKGKTMEKLHAKKNYIHNGIGLFREAAKDRRQVSNVLEILRQNNFQPKIKCRGEIRTFQTCKGGLLEKYVPLKERLNQEKKKTQDPGTVDPT